MVVQVQIPCMRGDLCGRANGIAFQDQLLIGEDDHA